MTRTALPTCFVYVEGDVAEGETLADWRRGRHAGRRSDRGTARPGLRLLRLLLRR